MYDFEVTVKVKSLFEVLVEKTEQTDHENEGSFAEKTNYSRKFATSDDARYFIRYLPKGHKMVQLLEIIDRTPEPCTDSSKD